MLIVFSGLPGVGKTAIARELAGQLGAIHLRIDSIEQALRTCGKPGDLADTGYRIAYTVAEDNLRLGHTVIADCVNPIELTRATWIAVAERAGVKAVEVEVTCSDPRRHRERVETRPADISGFRLPTWQEVASREYEPWKRRHIVIDTAGKSVSESTDELRQALLKARPRPGLEGKP